MLRLRDSGAFGCCLEVIWSSCALVVLFLLQSHRHPVDYFAFYVCRGGPRNASCNAYSRLSTHLLILNLDPFGGQA